MDEKPRELLYTEKQIALGQAINIVADKWDLADLLNNSNKFKQQVIQLRDIIFELKRMS